MEGYLCFLYSHFNPLSNLPYFYCFRRHQAMQKFTWLVLLIVIYCKSLEAQTDNPTANKPIVVNCSSTCAGSLGENIFPNGDFGIGTINIIPVNPDPDIASGFTYQTNPPPNDGYYCISNNTTYWGSFASVWVDTEDNGPETNGYMMVVNANYQPGLFYQKTVPVCENTPYEFSIDVINLIVSSQPGLIRPNISFLISGVEVCETGDIAPDEIWHTVRFSFISPPGQNNIEFALRNNAPGGNGNDLAIDNISLRTCGPGISVPPTVSFCGAGPLSIPSTLENAPYSTAYYLWQIFTNGAWEDIPNSNNDSLSLANPIDGSLIRLIVANSPNNLSMPNCRVVSSTILLKQVPGLVISTSAQNVSCSGESTGAVSADAIMGTAPYTFSWNIGSTASNVNNLSFGTYQVTITDALGCAGVASVSITEPPSLTTTTAHTTLSCFGNNNASAAVTVAGGVLPYQYLWDNGETNAALSGLVAGNYEVSVTDTNGCTISSTITITEPPLLTAFVNKTDVSCVGGDNASAVVSVAGGVSPYNYAWSNGQTNANVSGLVTGTYIVTVTDNNACTKVDAVTITEPSALLSSTTSTNVSCAGGNNASAVVSMTGGVSPYNFAWSNGQTNANVSGLVTGTYIVTVTDNNACTKVDAVTITEPSALSITSNTTSVSCFGGNDAVASASVTGGVSPYKYLWSNGQTNATNAGLSAGVYLFTITDDHACTASGAATVIEPALLTGIINSTTISCFGNATGTASALVAGGASPYTYVWSNGQTNATLSDLSAGTYTYTATDTKGCTVNGTTNITQPPPLALQTSTGAVACHGDTDAWANATVTGGLDPYHYLWSNGGTDNLINNLGAGIFNLMVTDNNGCKLPGTVTINQPAAIALSTSTIPVLCYGDANGAASVLINGGIAPYHYQWSNGSTTQANQNLIAGAYSITATDANGCTLTAQTTVVQPAALSSNYGVNDVDCHGNYNGEINVTVAGGTLPYHFLWSNGSVTPQIGNLAGGVYNLIITDQNNCILPITAQVNEPPPLILQTAKTNITCFGDKDGTLSSVATGGVIPYAYHWSSGQMTADIQDLESGTYTIQVTDANGCILSATESMAEPNVPVVHLGNDLRIHLGDIIELEAIINLPRSEVMDYTWSGSEDSLHCADCFTYSFQPTAPGCQQVLVRTKKGCIAIDTICYKLFPHVRVYAPNVFSPDGDGVNDFFTIFSDEGVKEILSLSIFNRWGGQIFQAYNIKTNEEPSGWDGTFKGQLMNIDVFVWTARLEFIDGQIINLSGDVTLVR